MKKLALIADRTLCVRTFWGLVRVKEWTTSNKDMRLTRQPKLGLGNHLARRLKEFSLQGVDGKTYRLSDYKGKKVYLKFWASWCSICLSTLGDTNDLAKAEEGKDYVVLSVVAPTFNGEKSAA